MRMSKRLLLLAFLVLTPAVQAQQRSDAVEHPVRLQQPVFKKEDGRKIWEARSDTLSEPFTGIILRGTTRPGTSLRGWIQLGGRDDWRELTILRQQRSSIFWAGYRSDSLLHAPFFRVRFEGEGVGSLEIIEAGIFNHLDDSLRGP